MKTNWIQYLRSLGCVIGTVLLAMNGLQAQVYNGNLWVTTQAAADAFSYTEVTGNLYISGSGIINLDGLSELQTVGGSLYLAYNNSLVNLNGLSSLTSIGEWFSLKYNPSLIDISGLSALSSIGSDFHIGFNDVLPNVDGLEGLTYLGGYLRINENPVLADLDGLSNLPAIGGYLYLVSNDALTQINGLSNLSTLGTWLSILHNGLLLNVDGLSSLQTLPGSVNIQFNDALLNLDGLSSVTSILGYLGIGNNAALTDLDGLASLTSIGGNLGILYNNSLTNVDGLSALTSVDGYLDINHNPMLTQLDGLSNLTSVDSWVSIQYNTGLADCNGLFSLLCENGVTGSISIANNGAGCTLTDILNSGPCSPNAAGSAQLLKDMNPGPANSSVYGTYQVNGHTLLYTNTGLWATDGSTAGTRLLTASVGFARVEGNYFYYVADGFWRTDGTVAGTEQLMYFTEVNGQYHLWKNDPAGDILVKVIPFETCVDYMGTTNYWDQSLIYRANYWQGHWWFEIMHDNYNGDCNENIGRRDIWITDGTPGGTMILHDLWDGDYMETLQFAVADANMVVYTTYSGGGCDYDFDVWAYDGSQAVSVDGYTADCGYGFPTISDFQMYQGKAYYKNRNCEEFYFGTDGLTSWPILNTGYLDKIGTFRDKLLLESFRIEPGGDCEYGYAGIPDVTISDGTQAGTESLGDNFFVASYTDPLLLKHVVDPYEAPVPAEGDELWISDGTAAGTVLLKDIWPGQNSGIDGGTQFVQWNGKVFFNAEDGSHGRELWISDLTSAGTQLVKDIQAGTEGSLTGTPFLGTNSQGVFFLADDGVNGAELWKTDGTSAGTILVADMNTGVGGTEALKGFGLGDKLIFEIKTGDASRELWVTDGTAAGTSLLRTFNTNVNNYNPVRTYEYTRLGDWLILRIVDGSSWSEESLWATDGTPAGTNLIAASDDWVHTYEPTAIVNNQLIFIGKDQPNGTEPWVYEVPISPASDFTLIDGQADTLIGPIESGAELDLTFLPTDRLNILLNNVPPEVDKVWFDLNAGLIAQFDNNLPFCMARDDQAGNYYYHTFTPGSYTLTAELKDGTTTVETRTLTFTIIESPQAVTSFSLVDALNNIVLGPLNHDDVIDLASVGTHKLNIIAHTAPNDIGSVDFDLRGEASFDQYDNQPPYCMAQDNQNGGYYQYLFSPGTYTLTATPYTQYAAGGDAGTPMTIGFTVVNSGARMAVPSESFRVYPNPTTGKLNLQFVNVVGGKADLQVFDLQGRLVQFQTLEVQPGTSELGVQVYDLARGMYMMTCRFGRERYTTQFIKQ